MGCGMWTEEKLEGILTTPSAELTADIARIQGDIMILGAGGCVKMIMLPARQSRRGTKKHLTNNRFSVILTGHEKRSVPMLLWLSR